MSRRTRSADSAGLREGLPAYQLAIRIHLDHLQRMVADKEEVIQALLACLPAVEVSAYLLSIRGVHPLGVALLLAEIGDPGGYTCAAQLIKLAGTQPTPNTSGRKRGSRTPMSHLGRSRLRYLLYWTCLHLIQINPDFSSRYKELQTRPKDPLTKMQALGVLMNKLLKVSWALMHHKAFYNPALTASA